MNETSSSKNRRANTRINNKPAPDSVIIRRSRTSVTLPQSYIGSTLKIAFDYIALPSSDLSYRDQNKSRKKTLAHLSICRPPLHQREKQQNCVPLITLWRTAINQLDRSFRHFSLGSLAHNWLSRHLAKFRQSNPIIKIILCAPTQIQRRQRAPSHMSIQRDMVISLIYAMYVCTVYIYDIV